MDGKSGYGASLKIGDGASSETFTEIPGVRDISGPALSVNMDDVSSHDAPNAVAPGMDKHGPVTFGMVLDTTDTQQQLLFTNRAAKTKTNFQLVSNEAGAQQYAFAAYISNIEPGEPMESGNIVNVTLTLDGLATVS